MPWNTDFFLLLNATLQPGTLMLLISGALATGPVLLAPVLLACLWVWGHLEQRAALLAVAAGTIVGQSINVVLGLTWYEPRPFMAGVGHTWVAHVADNGFPSDHATLAWSLGFGLILTGASLRGGIVACVLGIAAGWARVYLGVHYPIDVLVAAPIGLVAGAVALLLVPLMRKWFLPMTESVYEMLLDLLPAWISFPHRPHP